MRRIFTEKTVDAYKDIVIDVSETYGLLDETGNYSEEEIILFDGSGYEYSCRINNVCDGKTILSVVSKKYSSSEPSVRITLYCASGSDDVIETAFRKTCEIGISSFYFFDAARSKEKTANAELVAERLKNIGADVSRQCGRSKIPQAGFIGDTKDVADCISKHDCVILAYEDEKDIYLDSVIPKDAEDIGIIIGPENGFEREEADMLTGRGAKACSLGIWPRSFSRVIL